ncbi:MAG: NAD(P)H-hydrate dehydratase [Candidatus Bathyarchaeota archaeon]
MNQVITSQEMQALEQNAEYFQISRLQLMENAGRNVAAEVSARIKDQKEIVFFCGLGGNGGDGFVAARHLSAMGYKTRVILAGKAEQISHKEALVNWKALKYLLRGVSIQEAYDASLVLELKTEARALVVDALLGTGSKGRLRSPVSELVERINSIDAFRVAVDAPTGVNVDTGEILENAVRSNLTITFHKSKKGLELAKDYVGELIVKDIGLPKELEQLAGPGDVTFVKKLRPQQAHKGDFGRLLIIGGSEFFSGAPALAALAALRSGVDLTYIAAPEKTAQAISSMSPDLITIKMKGKHLNLGNVQPLETAVKMVDAVVIGPGLDLHVDTLEFIRSIIDVIEKAGKPLLLDADGLKAFSQFKRSLNIPLVLTPHSGEYTILTGKKLPESFWDKVFEVQKMALEIDAVILLKGPIDIVCNKELYKLNFTGNPGMAVGGTGDVLSGVVGAFLAQQINPFKAAVAGAFVNGAAGDFVRGEKGFHMMASDLIKWIPKSIDDPMSHMMVRDGIEKGYQNFSIPR